MESTLGRYIPAVDQKRRGAQRHPQSSSPLLRRRQRTASEPQRN